MEVFQTDEFYIFVKKEKSLWWNRKTSEFQIKCGWDLSSVFDIECIGITHGILGALALPGVFDPHLIIIKEAIPIGVLYPPHLVYKIKSICILSQEEPDIVLAPCLKHNANKINNATSSPSHKPRLFEGSQLVNKTWGAVKSAGSTIKSTTQQAAALASNQVKSSVGIKDPSRIERKITEELHKIFDDTDSFYYCLESDITHNLQRRSEGNSDDRFYWNKHMLKDIIKLNDPMWILPIIQGFVQVEQCVIEKECFTLALVSRRSRFRAGTRYKRRGVDEDGNCANYVETEQILSLRQHQISFTQVRGSVPVFWSQPGYKYRPPPRIDKNEQDTQKAFELHFNKELETYQSVCIVNLVEQSGKEKIIGDSFANHVVKYDSEKLIYVSFDFHEYCRGMHFENVSALIEALTPEASAMGFHWRDPNGPICNQRAVFRVNCMDCLDRTNVVQTALGKALLESQLVKLGLAPPYSQLPEPLKVPFMLLWANNGDIISRQYAGTNALKGDYTRTGERKLTGMMKDGMNSANRYIIQHFADTFRQSVIDLIHGNITDPHDICEDEICETIINITETALVPSTRPPLSYFNYGVAATEMRIVEELILRGSYYLARFKDTYRQATIDVMLGNTVSTESLNALGGQTGPDATETLESAEHARLLVEDCRRMLLGTNQLIVGAWGLIDADPASGDPAETEVDTILLLTDDCYIVAEYDSYLDKIVRFENVPLINITLIELGLFQQTKMFSGSAPTHLCMRLNYNMNSCDGYFHMFRSPNIRFFNNVAIIIKKPEEIHESMSAIVEFFRIALENLGRSDVPVIAGGNLQRRKSRSLLGVSQGIPRNLSESQLVQIGSKALSNVAGQFSKLGQTLNVKGKKNTAANRNNINPHIVYNTPASAGDKKLFKIGSAALKRDEYSSESDDNDCSIYEPDGSDLIQENPIYNENNDFLPSVGIVMSRGNTDQNAHLQPTILENKDNITKRLSSDVSTMSISSVTENVPPSLLDYGSPMRNRSPTPEIRIQSSEDGEKLNAGLQSGHSFSKSSNEMKLDAQTSAYRSSSERDLTLNLTGSQSENALKQLKTLTSPLSKLAKGMQSFGANLDPRKMTTRTVVVPKPIVDLTTNDVKQLEEMWESSKCKTKLIAL